MSLERAKRGLRNVGIFWIVCGGFLTVMGIILLTGAGVAGSDPSDAENAAKFLTGGITNLIIGLDALIEGILCIGASKKASRAMPVMIFAVLGIVLSIIKLVSGALHADPSGIASGLASLAVNGILFYMANIVKKGDA